MVVLENRSSKFVQGPADSGVSSGCKDPTPNKPLGNPGSLQQSFIGFGKRGAHMKWSRGSLNRQRTLLELS